MLTCTYLHRVQVQGGRRKGGGMPPVLTLFQPRGQIMPTTLALVPPDFGSSAAFVQALFLKAHCMSFRNVGKLNSAKKGNNKIEISSN